MGTESFLNLILNSLDSGLMVLPEHTVFAGVEVCLELLKVSFVLVGELGDFLVAGLDLVKLLVHDFHHAFEGLMLLLLSHLMDLPRFFLFFKHLLMHLLP